jgi:acyl-CoA dehydrogenase
MQRVFETARLHASRHDRDSTFPSETLEAARQEGLLAAYVPVEFGGQGLSISRIAEICAVLGGACGSSGLIFAMHQIQLASLVRHLDTGRRDEILSGIARDQPLIASSTTEGSAGGDMSRSECAILAHDNMFRLAKAASVMSYGAEADMILATARRTPDAPTTDQVLAILPRECVSLTPRGGWRSLGMRGTCSGSFDLLAEAPLSGVIQRPYREILAATMEPVAHLLWGAVWCGIAAEALETARRFLRRAAARGGGSSPPGSDLFAEALGDHISARSLLEGAAAAFDADGGQSAERTLVGAGAASANLKVKISEGMLSVVLRSLKICGLAGYRIDGDHSVERQLRDICSAPIMINNTRLRDSIGKLGLVQEVRSWGT